MPHAVLAGLLVLFALLAGFPGKYKASHDGTEYLLELAQDGAALTGSATASGVRLTLTGTVTAEGAEGTLDMGGEKLPFRAKLTDKGLTLTVADVDDDGRADWSDADVIAFERTAEAAPQPKKGGPLSRRFQAAPTAILANGKVYTHASGGQFRYPADWRLEETDGAIKLVPPDAGANELYAVTAEPAAGKTDAADPEVIAYLDQVVRGQAPALRRVGGVERAPAGNTKGAVLTWEGDGETGRVRLRAWVTILKGHGVSLLALGPPEVIEKRAAVLREVFHTFGWGQGRTDKRLVGAWSHWSYNAKSGVEKSARATLGADGTFAYDGAAESSNSFQGKNQYGDVTWVGGVGGRTGSGFRGTWFADGSELTFNFEDGSTETFDYVLKEQNGNVFLVLTGSDPKKPQEWRRQ